MTADQDFFDELRRQGRYAPRGWHQFYRFLQSRKRVGEIGPPRPLILAAAGESPWRKRRRLLEQLDWARLNGCFDDALVRLVKLTAEEWDACPIDEWHREHYQ